MENQFDENISEIIEDYSELSEKPDELILNENEDLILEHFQVENLASFKSSNYRYEIEQAYFTYPKVNDAEQAKKYLKIYRLWLLIRINQQKENFSHPHLDKIELAYNLASYRSELRKTEWELENFDKRVDWLHQIKCSAGIQKRHEPRNKRYREACQLAEKMWAAGDGRIRHKMATFVISKFPELSYRKLQNLLTPIAKRYDKLYDPKAPRKPK